MNRLGIDVGKVRIGVAFNVGSLVMADSVIARNSESIAKIQEIVNQRQSAQVVVGLPISLSGIETQATKDALRFASELAKAVGIPVVMLDERLSTVSAAKTLHSVGVDSKAGRQIIDAESARVILESAISGAKLTPVEEFDA